MKRLPPLFTPQARRGAVGLQMGRVHHQHRSVLAFVGQFDQDAGEDPQPAPADPAVVEGLVRTIDRRRITPTQPIEIDGDNSAKHLLVIDARNPV